MEEVIDFSITPAVPGAFRDNYRPLYAAVIGQHFSVIKAMCSTALSFNPITDHSLSQPRSSNHTLHHLRTLRRGRTRRRGAGLKAQARAKKELAQRAWERLRADCSISTADGRTHTALDIQLEGNIYIVHF